MDGPPTSIPVIDDAIDGPPVDEVDVGGIYDDGDDGGDSFSLSICVDDGGVIGCDDGGLIVVVVVVVIDGVVDDISCCVGVNDMVANPSIAEVVLGVVVFICFLFDLDVILVVVVVVFVSFTGTACFLPRFFGI